MPYASLVVPACTDPSITALLDQLGARPGDVLSIEQFHPSEPVAVLRTLGADMLPVARELLRRLGVVAGSSAPHCTAVVPVPPSPRVRGPWRRASRRSAADDRLRILR